MHSNSISVILSQVKIELDKMLEAKDRALGLFESIEKERVQFVEKEKEYEVKLNKMGVELNGACPPRLNF